jgi:TrmH family RNA methyltransferase
LAALAYRHQKVQRLRRLVGRRSAREAERAFVAEGAKVVGEALDAGSVETLFVDPTALGPAEVSVVDRAFAAGCRVFELEKGVLERVAGTVTPQPLLAVVPFVDRPLGDLARDAVIVVCSDVRDPGNLGTVLRSAEAAGVRGVVCADGTVDPYNPKCVRASAGALFHVPLVVGGNTVQVLGELGAWGLRRFGTSVRGGTPLWDADLTGPLALVLGNEATGLDPTVDGCLDGQVTIPIDGRAESLNVGMAAAVLVYEVARQRRDGAATSQERQP